MDKNRHSLFLLLCLLASGSAKVWVNQSHMEGYYKEGDMATLLCQIHSDQEKVEDCEFEWYIWDVNVPIAVQTAEKYQHRVTLDSNQTFTSLKVKDLSVNDTDQLKCVIECFVDEEKDRYFGSGTILFIHNKNEKNGQPVLNAEIDADLKQDNSWIGFLLISINIVIFFIITAICVSMIKKMKKSNG